MGRHDRDGNAVTRREGRRRDEGARDREREMRVQETEREIDEKEESNKEKNGEGGQEGKKSRFISRHKTDKR